MCERYSLFVSNKLHRSTGLSAAASPDTMVDIPSNCYATAQLVANTVSVIDIVAHGLHIWGDVKILASVAPLPTYTCSMSEALVSDWAHFAPQSFVLVNRKSKPVYILLEPFGIDLRIQPEQEIDFIETIRLSTDIPEIVIHEQIEGFPGALAIWNWAPPEKDFPRLLKR